MRPTQWEPSRKVTIRDLMRHTSGFTYGIFGNTPVDKLYRQQHILGNRDLTRDGGGNSERFRSYASQEPSGITAFLPMF